MEAPEEATMDAMSIGAVAKEANLAASAIRYYEAEGLLPAIPRVGGKRRYARDVLGRLELIRMGQDAGFSLQEIKELMAGIDGGAEGPAALATLAANKLPQIEETLKRLALMQKLLRAASECRCPTLRVCLGEMKRAGLAQPRSSGSASSANATSIRPPGMPLASR